MLYYPQIKKIDEQWYYNIFPLIIFPFGYLQCYYKSKMLCAFSICFIKWNWQWIHPRKPLLFPPLINLFFSLHSVVAFFITRWSHRIRIQQIKALWNIALSSFIEKRVYSINTSINYNLQGISFIDTNISERTRFSFSYESDACLHQIPSPW